MSWSIFAVVTGIFVLRGLFLGFVGVISKIIGIILAYFMAFNFRMPVAEFIATQTTLNIPITVLPIISSILIFFGTLIVTGLVISLLCKLLASIVPPLKSLLSNESMTAKLFGAITNGAIGAFIVLLCIWGYDKATEADPNQDALHKIAYTVGTTAFNFATEGDAINITSSFSKKQTSSKQGSSHTETSKTVKGTAYIVSEENPNKKLSIETITEIIGQIAEDQNPNIDSKAFFDTEKIQELINNSALRDMALEQIRNNPEKVTELMSSPEMKQVLESLGKQQSQ